MIGLDDRRFRCSMLGGNAADRLTVLDDDLPGFARWERCRPARTRDDQPLADFDLVRRLQTIGGDDRCLGQPILGGNSADRLTFLHDDLAASIRADAADAMREAIAAAEAEPPASVELLFEHAYVDPPTSFGSDLEELRRVLG